MADKHARARRIGKATELRLAHEYGTARNLDQNRADGGPDFFIASRFGVMRDGRSTPELAAEVKHRKKLPLWLEAALDKGDIVFLKEKGKRYDHCAVLMRRDLLDAMLGREEVNDAR
jgi:hypothetical protein